MANPKRTRAQEKLEDPEATIKLEDLSERQRKAITNHELGMSWHQALLKAGYSERSASHPKEFLSNPTIARLYNQTSERFKRRLKGDILSSAENQLTRGLVEGEINSEIVSLIKLVLKYAGLEPATKQKIEQTVTQEDGGSELDLSVLYEVLDPEDAEKALRALQEDDG